MSKTSKRTRAVLSAAKWAALISMTILGATSELPRKVALDLTCVSAYKPSPTNPICHDTTNGEVPHIRVEMSEQ